MEKEYHIQAQYPISVYMNIKANSLEEAMEIAENCGDCINTEWNGNSVFVDEYAMDDAVTEMTVNADGILYDFECEEEDEE